VTLNEELRQLRSRYTEENPAVKSKLAEIEDFKKLHPQLQDLSATSERITGLDADIERLQKEIAALEDRRDQVRREIDRYGSRINQAPLHEQALASLMRDYDNLKKEYEDLLRRRDISVRGEDLEEAGRVEQFKIQDRARPPATPYSPRLIVVALLCLAVGGGIAVGATAILEFLDQTFRSEEEVKHAFPGIPVLASIPRLESRGGDKGKGKGKGKRKRAGSEAAALALLVCVSWVVSGGAGAWWSC
jgi:uncharacterized protein involved in exopolysaccharide biosynthesis